MALMWPDRKATVSYVMNKMGPASALAEPPPAG
jgi:hypothetical protein